MTAPQIAANETAERILDAAERLLGERGVAGTSVRAVTAEAGVNLGALHYHFGSKENLVRAVVERRVGPLNAARLARLDALEAAGSVGAEGVPALVDALVAPVLEAWDAEGRRPLASFLANEPVEAVAPLLAEVFGGVERRFTDALCCALPQLGRETVRERLQLVVALVLHVVGGRFDAGLASFEAGRGTAVRPPRSAASILHSVCTFAVAGLRAPAEGDHR